MTNIQTASLQWQQKMHFKGTNENGQHSIPMDATLDHGGEGHGPTPKELLLQAMMGCTAMDVISMLEKMRQKIENFEMKIEAQKNTHHPIYFKSSTLKYYLTGDIQPDKAIKAIDSSLTKYCGVNFMISKAGKIFFELHVNNTLIHQGEAHFIEPLAD